VDNKEVGAATVMEREVGGGEKMEEDVAEDKDVDVDVEEAVEEDEILMEMVMEITTEMTMITVVLKERTPRPTLLTMSLPVTLHLKLLPLFRSLLEVPQSPLLLPVPLPTVTLTTAQMAAANNNVAKESVEREARKLAETIFTKLSSRIIVLEPLRIHST